MKPDRSRKEIEQAWIRHAVSLNARSHILASENAANGEAPDRMTSNRFHAAFGEPTWLSTSGTGMALLDHLRAKGSFEGKADRQ